MTKRKLNVDQDGPEGDPVMVSAAAAGTKTKSQPRASGVSASTSTGPREKKRKTLAQEKEESDKKGVRKKKPSAVPPSHRPRRRHRLTNCGIIR